MYILKTNLNETLPIITSIQSIYGIGYSNARKICKAAGLLPQTKTNMLNNRLKSKIQQFVEKNYVINEKLKQDIVHKKEQLRLLRTVRGLRGYHNLPRRGQRTHTNAKTVKRVR